MSFYLSTGKSALQTEGVYFAVPPSMRPDSLADLPARTHAVLGLAHAAGQPDPIVVGAIPFDSRAEARLVVPLQVQRATAPVKSAPTQPNRLSATPVPSEADYARSVGKAVSRLRAKDFEKVVLARSLRLTGADPLDARQLLARLAEANPGSHVFAVDLGDGRTLIGASPELLLSRFGNEVTTHPLAGSTPRSADPAQDRQRANALLKSGKDLREHAYVVEAITATLEPLCKTVTVPSGPSLVATPTMWHLGTRITAEVADPDDPAVSALALATALHPTPAVCGSPADKARAAIAEYEPFDRGFYAGMVGWGNLRGDGEWAVTIRCGVVDGSSLTLYAGAGVVADSDPQAELAETSAKFRTLLEVLKG